MDKVITTPQTIESGDNVTPNRKHLSARKYICPSSFMILLHIEWLIIVSTVAQVNRKLLYICTIIQNNIVYK